MVRTPKLSWRFPRKSAFLGDFPLSPWCPPPQKRKFCFYYLRDSPNTTTTTFELISQEPTFQFWGTLDDASNAPSTQWNTEKMQRFYIWCVIKWHFDATSDAKPLWKIMVVVVFGPSLIVVSPSLSSSVISWPQRPRDTKRLTVIRANRLQLPISNAICNWLARKNHWSQKAYAQRRAWFERMLRTKTNSREYRE